MRCGKLYDALLAVSSGNDPGAGMREELVGKVLAARSAPAGDQNELEGVKAELLQTRQQLERIVAMLDGSMAPDRSDGELQASFRQAKAGESGLRQRIIALVSSGTGAPVTGAPLTLTFKGREALETIGARLPAAADMDWDELGRRVERLKAALASEAAQAAAILKQISGELPPAQQHLLRSAAVGLASVPGDPAANAQLFRDLFKQLKNTFLDDQYAAAGAEMAIAGAAGGKGDARKLASETGEYASQLWRDQGLDREEYRSMPVLLMAMPPGERDAALEAARSDRQRLLCALGPALLHTGSPGLQQLKERQNYFSMWLNVLREDKMPPPPDAVVAAALLATAAGDRQAIETRFRQAEEFMVGLFEETMHTPSAVIALWPAGVAESLDNIRLASSEILRNRLSLGGVENFSLGMKLLSNNAQTAALEPPGAAPEWMRPPSEAPSYAVAVAAATAAAAATAGAVLLATPLLARAPFTLFHSITVQQAAVRQVTFHPVHSHYLYG
jgi:hypothetical protein